MIFTKEKIDYYLQNCNQIIENDQNTHLKRQMVGAMVKIDRWGEASTDYIFNTSKKYLFKFNNNGQFSINDVDYKFRKLLLLDKVKNIPSAILAGDLTKLSDDYLAELCGDSLTEADRQPVIWGRTIHFSEFCPENIGILISIDLNVNLLNGLNSIATFKIKE